MDLNFQIGFYKKKLLLRESETEKILSEIFIWGIRQHVDHSGRFFISASNSSPIMFSS